MEAPFSLPQTFLMLQSSARYARRNQFVSVQVARPWRGLRGDARYFSRSTFRLEQESLLGLPQAVLVDQLLAMTTGFKQVQPELVALQAEMLELRGQLRQNMQNSSKPPSTNGSAGQGRGGQGGKQVGHKDGEQAGHQGKNLLLYSADKV